MPTLTALLLEVSNALLFPVVVGLLALAAASLLLAGGALRERLERRRGSGAAQSGYRARVVAMRVAGGFDTAAERELLDSLEVEIADRLGRLQLVARLGPMLGLMGTLIPLGPALMSFAGGDLESLASQLVVAFSTTVVGLFAGAVACVTAHFRRIWWASDLAWIEAAE
jgi:hypothetical protein